MRATAERASMATRWLPRRCLSQSAAAATWEAVKVVLRRQRAVKDDTNAVYLSLRVSMSFLAVDVKMHLSSVTLSRVSAWAKWSRASLSCEPEPLRCAPDRSRALHSGFASPPQAKICQSPRRQARARAPGNCPRRDPPPVLQQFLHAASAFILQYLALWGGSPVAPLARRGAPFSSTQRRGVVCS